MSGLSRPSLSDKVAISQMSDRDFGREWARKGHPELAVKYSPPETTRDPELYPGLENDM